MFDGPNFRSNNIAYILASEARLLVRSMSSRVDLLRAKRPLGLFNALNFRYIIASVAKL